MSLSSGTSVDDCTTGFYLVPYCQPNPPTPMEYATSASLEWHVSPGRRSIYYRSTCLCRLKVQHLDDIHKTDALNTFYLFHFFYQCLFYNLCMTVTVRGLSSLAGLTMSFSLHSKVVFVWKRRSIETAQAMFQPHKKNELLLCYLSPY